MHYVALAVVCAALIFLSYHSPKVGFSLLGALAVVLTALYFLNLEESEISKFPVPKESVALSTNEPTVSYGDSWDYSGRVSNSSDKNITDIQIRITLYDCPTNSGEISTDCVTIGDDVDYVAINIPARQARDFKNNISFRNAQAKGKALWSFELVGIRVTD